MKRVGELLDRWLASRPLHIFVRARIETSVNDRLPGALPAAVQRRVSRIRTDLNAFSSLEVHSLVRHGYEVAQEALLAEGWVTARRPIDTFSPVAATTLGADEWARALQRSSSRTVLPLLALTDWPTWVLLLIVAVAMSLFAM